MHGTNNNAPSGDQNKYASSYGEGNDNLNLAQDNTVGLSFQEGSKQAQKTKNDSGVGGGVAPNKTLSNVEIAERGKDCDSSIRLVCGVPTF